MNDPETLTRYDCHEFECEDGEYVLYADHLAALTAERARAGRAEQERDTLRERLRHHIELNEQGLAIRDTLRAQLAALQDDGA